MQARPQGKGRFYKNRRFLPGLQVKHSKTACFIQEGNFTSDPQNRKLAYIKDIRTKSSSI